MSDLTRFAASTSLSVRAWRPLPIPWAAIVAVPLLACGTRPATPAAGPPTSTAAAVAPASPRCAAHEFHQFDFWAGDWDVYDRDAPATPAARAHVDPVVGGCALREVYEQNDGLVGESTTFYDSSNKTWHHTWVTNRGQVLEIAGTTKGDAVVLQGMHRGGNAPDKIVRMEWKVEKDGVRETADSSMDGGVTWKPMFDMVFRRHVREAAQGSAAIAK